MKRILEDYFETWKNYLRWKARTMDMKLLKPVDSPDIKHQIDHAINGEILNCIERMIPKPWFTGMFRDWFTYERQRHVQ